MFKWTSLNSNKLYLDITESISWASSNCVLFILLRKLINGVQLLNITFLLVFFTAAPAHAVFLIVIVVLVCMYASW